MNGMNLQKGSPKNVEKASGDGNDTVIFLHGTHNNANKIPTI
jgi:hypothetical protein